MHDVGDTYLHYDMGVTTMCNNTELKPCPFCGGNAEMKSYTMFWVVCDDCLSETTVYSTEEEAIEAWNRRATDVR